MRSPSLVVELDNQLFVDICGDVRSERNALDLALEVVAVDLDPLRQRRAIELGQRVVDLRDLAALLADQDLVTSVHEVAGDVDLLAVDREVAVANQLARLGVAGCETAANRDVVEPTLE